MDCRFCEDIANKCIRSILYEVSVTPKPGLVDRDNPGAHDDMDFFTFMDSVSVLSGYFYRCTLAGKNFLGDDYIELMANIRPIGIRAEEDMFQITKGINTHKGMIFSLGIISAAIGSLYGNKFTSKELVARIREMTRGISSELEAYKNKEDKDLTYGEELYKLYGIRGIRGEAEDGYPTVVEHGLPSLRDSMGKSKDINKILLNTLLNLMANTEDSNILGRHDIETLYYVKEESKNALELGGAFTEEGIEYIKKMDVDFIEKNISSGGAADLLSVTILFYLIDGGEF